MEYNHKKTIAFDGTFGVSIDDITLTTKEVNRIIERARGGKLRISKIKEFSFDSYDIDEMVDDALRD